MDGGHIAGRIRGYSQSVVRSVFFNTDRDKCIPVKCETVGMKIVICVESDSDFAGREGGRGGNGMSCVVCQQRIPVAQVIDVKVVFRTEVEVVEGDVYGLGMRNADAPEAIGVVQILSTAAAIGNGSLRFMIDLRDAVGHVPIGVEAQMPASIGNAVIREKVMYRLSV